MDKLKALPSSFVRSGLLNKARSHSKKDLGRARLKAKTKLERIEDMQFDDFLLQEKASIEDQMMNELHKDGWSRNILLVSDLLNQLPYFVTFTHYYHMSENSIRQIASIAQLRLLDTNEVLFQVGDHSDAFYIIVKGTIIIKEKKGNHDLLNDKLCLSVGSCFGEFGLLYSIPRTQTCIAEESTILLSISKDHFNKILKKLMLKAETDRKMLVSTILPSVKYLSQKKFLSFYRYFSFLIYKKNDLVFKQGDIAHSIYLIQYGKCRLMKDNRHILTMGENDFVGLEAIENDPCIKEEEERSGRKPSARYDYSLYCYENCTILQIRLSSLGDLYYQVKTNISLLRKTKDIIITKYNKQNEKCSFHQYRFLSYLTKKDQKEFNCDAQTSPLSIIDKANKSSNSVSMKKLYIKPTRIQNGISKPNHHRYLSYHNLQTDSSKSKQNFTNKHFITLTKTHKSRNTLSKIAKGQLDFTKSHDKPISSQKVQKYMFDTGTCSLPLLALSKG